MKCALVFGLSFLAAVAVCVATTRADDKAKNPNLGKVRHVVLFKFKDGTTPEQIKKVEDAFRELPSKIPQIEGYEWGTNMSPEKLDQGFTHCFLLTFATAKDRDAYLPHPAHKAFGKVLRPYLDKVLVLDFEAKE
jgi:hypothetical protein